jgi:M6 family metalloprotease-like protein
MVLIKIMQKPFNLTAVIALKEGLLMKRIRLSSLAGWVLLVLFVGGALVNAYAPLAEAVPAMPGIRNHVQSSGRIVYYQVFGDEFLNYMADSNGDLLAFGENGDICYANWISENDLPSGGSPSNGRSAKNFPGFAVPTKDKPQGNAVDASPPSENQMTPLRTSIPKFLLDYAGKQMAERDAAWRKGHGENATPIDARDNAPSDAVVERNLLVIYVRFADEDNIAELKDKELSNSAIYDLVFNDAKSGSVAHYYKTVTGGGVKFIPVRETYESEDDGIIKVRVSGKHGNWQRGSFPSVLGEALSSADDYIDAASYNTNGGEYFTTDELSIMFVIHGYESSAVSISYPNLPSVWGRAGTFYGYKLDNINVSYYCAFGAFQSVGDDPRPFTGGIVVHELGHHSFGFLDFYNIGSNRTRGITGAWSVMGVGSWGALVDGHAGSTPTGLDAYHLSTLFFPTATVSAENLENLQQFSLTNSSQFIKLGPISKQYFLLQPRGNIGYDRGVLRYVYSWSDPYGGLMIYHIDEDKAPSVNDVNPEWATHPFLDIEEAHGGQQHLQNDLNNNGTADDLFYGSKNQFGKSSDPDSKLYNGDDSGVSVADIAPTVNGQNTPTGSVTVSFEVGTNSTSNPVTGITLNKTAMSLIIGEIGTLIATVEPDTASDKRVSWTTSNSDVADVNAGVVTAISEGSATIKAISQKKPDVYAECSVTVNAISVALESAEADGAAGTERTTKIDLTFDKAITGLIANNINIASNGGSAAKGVVSGSGKNWSVAVTNVTTGSVTVSVSSYGPYKITGSYPVDVFSLGPTINTSSLLGGTVGAAYSQELNASGTAPITWSIVNGSGSLPAGLTLDGATGVISGTPTTAETATFTVKAQNSDGDNTKKLSIVISSAPAAPTINTSTLAGGTVGTAYSQEFNASGTAPITWSIVNGSGSLPAGLTLGGATGVISGTPTAAGTANFTVKAENSGGSDTKSLSIVISPAPIKPTINTSSLAGGTVGTAYSQTLSASGTAPITWSIDSGSLPAGLNLNETTGEISGKPTEASTANFIVRATNIGGSAAKSLSIVISPAPVAPTINTSSLLGGTVGAAYSQTLSASGTAPITWSIDSGSLPAGLNLNGTTGEISGTPTTEGTANFTVKATNSGGSAAKPLSIVISPAPIKPTIDTSTLAGGMVGTAYSQTLSASGTAPITWSIPAGNLPRGLALNSTTGEIFGTPTTPETVYFAIRAANSAGNATKALSIVISPAESQPDPDPDPDPIPTPIVPAAPTIITSSLAGGTVGRLYNQTLSASGTAPITWSIDSGNLPFGLFLNTTTGIISGTPTAAGRIYFTIKAANSAGNTTKTLSITVASVPHGDGGGGGGGGSGKSGGGGCNIGSNALLLFFAGLALVKRRYL